MDAARSGLTNDELGHAGEAAFALLCAQAKLTANKSERDRTGWDFLVEFPLPERRRGLCLDQRAPTACRVQIKATVGAKRSVLKLSAAELLAKAAGPTLIIALRLDEHGKVVGGAAIPMIGANLAKVLRRLREAEARNQSNLNHATISFDAKRDGRTFDPTPEGLLSCLAALCGADPRAYILEKERQLSELGYEDGRYFVNTTLQAETPEDLLDAFLGLRPVTTTKFESYEARFGIRSPVNEQHALQEGTMHIEPDPAGRCSLSVHGPGLEPPARYDVDVYLAPPMPSLNLFKLALKHPDLLVTFSTSEIKLEITDKLSSGTKPLRRWLNIFRTIRNLKDGNGRLRLSGWRAEAPAEFEIKAALSSSLISQLPEIIAGTEALIELFSRAGIGEETTVTFPDLRRATDDIRVAEALLLKSETARFQFWIDLDDENVDDELSFLHPGHIVVGELQVAYAVRLDFRRNAEDLLKYESTRIEALDLREIGAEDLRLYGKARATERGLPCTFDHLEPWCLEPKGPLHTLIAPPVEEA